VGFAVVACNLVVWGCCWLVFSFKKEEEDDDDGDMVEEESLLKEDCMMKCLRNFYEW